MIRGVAILAVALIAAGALFFGIRAGDDGAGGDDSTPAVSASDRDNSGDPDRDGGDVAGGGNRDGSDDGGPKPVLPESTCPPDLTNCVVASGRVIYVEAVDPDGDGDAHFVTESEDGVTVPGLTIFDVRIDLRPDPLPEVGDLVGGAGPVYRGSYGQKQIEVIEFHVAR
jgi:hypothetical protein